MRDETEALAERGGDWFGDREARGMRCLQEDLRHMNTHLCAACGMNGCHTGGRECGIWCAAYCSGGDITESIILMMN
jgi:hypothetical protein